jgi:hypothetical protein
MKRHLTIPYLIVPSLLLATACAPTTQTALAPAMDLTVNLLYPLSTTESEMGQSLKSIIQVTDAQGTVVGDAQVTLSLTDPDGQLVASVPAVFGGGNVYRTDSLKIPHKAKDGNWTLVVAAKTGAHEGMVTQALHIKYSINEILMNKYGFWVDSPTLRGIVPSLVKERGDAHNGLITLGGIFPAQHVFPENWVEVQWREGDFKLATADDVHVFMLNILGNPGFYPMRNLESFERATFKNWDAWLVKSRSQLSRYDEQWMIFYSPEVDKTFAIGTIVVLPPMGSDAHGILRDGFEVHPEIKANGSAPTPLEDLLPPVELTNPELGARFLGTDQPIILKWKPAKELARDEYYLLRVDFNYDEGNSIVDYTTRETEFTLPVFLYSTPNCGVFNWQVTLMKQTGTSVDGQPVGKALSYRSLYWFVRWLYPPGADVPFNPLCPNEQF